MPSHFEMEFIARPHVRTSHEHPPIRQVYGWLRSHDKRVVLVTKDGQSWQFPGGKPRAHELPAETLRREVYEETGISLDVIAHPPTFFGYYHIREVQPDGTIVDEFIQLRYYVGLSGDAQYIPLQPQEHEQSDTVTAATFVTVDDACQMIPWLDGSLERQTFMQIGQ